MNAGGPELTTHGSEPAHSAGSTTIMGRPGEAGVTWAAGLAARSGAGLAVPCLGGECQAGRGDGVLALLAAAESAGRQPGERLFYVGKGPAGGDRAPQDIPQFRGGGMVAALVGASCGGVMVGQGQLRDLAQPCLPPRLEEGAPMRQGSGSWAPLDEGIQFGGRIRLSGWGGGP